MSNPNIAIIWDFDGTLTPLDSTTEVVNHLQWEGEDDFWRYIKSLRGDKKQPVWEHVLASDAPIWMYSLSRLAFKRKIPLNTEFFKKFIVSQIRLYPGVTEFLHNLKALEITPEFKKTNIEIHHFIISAGLQELIQAIFAESGIIRWVFGCRYTILAPPDDKASPESVPVFCMDETMKTRSLFEISKGSFQEQHKSVNARVEKKDLWVPFENMIYIGDSDTDIPALSLVRDRGGLGVVVYDPDKDARKVEEKLNHMKMSRRADLITTTDFSPEGELFRYLSTRCHQIRQRHEAELP